MLKEKDILYENTQGFWVRKVKALYVVMCPTGLVATSESVAYTTLDMAKARADYLAKRKATKELQSRMA